MSKRPRRTRKLPVSDQLRQAIETSGLTVYRLAQLSGVHKSALSRFLSGERGLSTNALDALGEVLDLEVTMHGP